MVLRMLSRAHSRLLGVIAGIDPDLLRVETSTALPLADHADGLTLPANRNVVAVTVLQTGANARSFDVPIVPAHLRDDKDTHPAAVYQIGNVLYLRGTAQDWRNIASVAVATIPVPLDITASTGALVVPDEAFDCLVQAVALDLARRGLVPPVDGLPPIDLRAFIEFARDSEQAFLTEVRRRVSRRVAHTVDATHLYD
jgi:hypothetical protein